MKKLLFWTAVIVGILAAVAVIMKRRSGGDEDSWQGYLEDSKGFVNKSVDDAMSGPDAADKAKDAVDAAADEHQGRDRSRVGHVEGRGREGQARHFLAAVAVRCPPARCGPPPPRWGDRSSHSIAASGG